MSSQKSKQPVQTRTTPVTASNIASQPKADLFPALREEALVWILTIFSTLAAYVVFAFILQKIYHPDIAPMLATAKELLVSPGAARPEPVESMLFRTGIIIILSGLLGFYTLFSKMPSVKSLAQKPAFLVIVSLCVVFIIALIYLDFTAINPYGTASGEQLQNSRDMVGKTNFDFYFDGFFLGNALLLYTFIITPLMACLFFFGLKKYHWGENKLFNLSTNVIGYLVAGGTVLALVLMHTFYFPYSYENKFDFNAVYYSMTQVYAGVPLLVNNFTNTYGLYPQLLNPLFQVIGLSVFSFSMVMSLLMGLAFVFNFFVLKKFVSNRIILFLGFLTMIFFPVLIFRISTPFDSTFSLYPIRYIIPSTLVFLAALYVTRRSLIIYWVTFIVMAFFILWNPEIGMVSYISWLLMNTFHDFYDKEGKPAIKKIVMHWLYGIGVLIAVFYAYKFTIYAVYGSMPDLSLLFNTIKVFASVGFNLLPMALVHPWNIMVLILMLGFTYSISKWVKKETTPKASIVFLISVIGIGFFFYFQGRSHNWSLSSSSAFWLMLLAILGDELWQAIKDKNVLPLNALFVVFLFLISFSFIEVIYNSGKLNELVYQDDDKENGLKEQERINGNRDFILKHTANKEKVYAFTAIQLQGLYFDGSKRLAAFNPSFEDMFLKTDVTRMERQLRDSSYTVFIEPALCNFPFMINPLAAMAATYELADSNRSMKLLRKRKTKVPSASFFAHSAPAVFHEKYTDDTTGLNLRIQDELGTAPVSLNPEFSVEILFDSKAQVYPFATLAGNMNDSAGFIIANILNTPNYFFGVNGKGGAFAFPPRGWVYCVMNVFPDHLDVYANGNLAGTLPLPQPMRRSPEKLYIGNLGYLRYYLGAISEVAISNKAIDKAQVQATWEEIRQAMGNK